MLRIVPMSQTHFCGYFLNSSRRNLRLEQYKVNFKLRVPVSHNSCWSWSECINTWNYSPDVLRNKYKKIQLAKIAGTTIFRAKRGCLNSGKLPEFRQGSSGTASANAAAKRHLVVLNRDPKIVTFCDSVNKKSERANTSAVAKFLLALVQAAVLCTEILRETDIILHDCPPPGL